MRIQLLKGFEGTISALTVDSQLYSVLEEIGLLAKRLCQNLKFPVN